MAQDLDRLLESVEPKSFQPYCYRSLAADTLTVYFKDEPDYSKRLTDHVTLYLSIDSNEPVGCRIKGVEALIADLPNYVKIKHEGFELSLLFLAFRGEAESEVSRTISKLAKSIADTSLTLTDCVPA